MSRVLTVLACTAFVLAGCGTPSDPEVTFYAAGKTVRLTPTVYCDLRGDNCAELAQPATLKVPPGQPVQISVPGSLADGRWEVVYSYVDSDVSQLVGGQSDLLGRGDDYAFTVTVPDRADQLVRVQVHEAAAAVLSSGAPVLRGAWVIDVVAG